MVRFFFSAIVQNRKLVRAVTFSCAPKSSSSKTSLVFLSSSSFTAFFASFHCKSSFGLLFTSLESVLMLVVFATFKFIVFFFSVTIMFATDHSIFPLNSFLYFFYTASDYGDWIGCKNDQRANGFNWASTAITTATQKKQPFSSHSFFSFAIALRSLKKWIYMKMIKYTKKKYLQKRHIRSSGKKPKILNTKAHKQTRTFQMQNKTEHTKKLTTFMRMQKSL